jgi:2'-5' RNA ligase
MVAVVCAAFDARGDAAIRAAQDRLREHGVRVSRDPAHRPHITLAAADADPEEIARIAAAIALRHTAFAIELDRVGTFAGGTIVWLGPSRATLLAALHRDVHDALNDAGHPSAFGRQSDPQHWTPHCTLARRAPRRAVARLRADFAPVEVRMTALATIVVGGRGDVALAPLPAA